MSRRAVNAIMSGYLPNITDKTKASLQPWIGGPAGQPKQHKGPRHQCKRKKK